MINFKEQHARAKLIVPEENWPTIIGGQKEIIENYQNAAECSPKEAYQDIRANIMNECRLRLLFLGAATYELTKK